MESVLIPGSTAARILDAAEQLFARRGYYGVSIREVAAASRTELSLTRYHFGSKDELFRQVIARRAEPVTQATYRALQEALLANNNEPLSAEIIVCAFITPLARLPTEQIGWRYYLKLMIHSDSLSDRPELLKPLRDAYKPVFEFYVAELVRGGYARERASWLMYFIHWMIGHMAFEVYELEQLSEGLCSSSDHDTLIARVMSFTIGGAAALGSI
ncbi:MAG: bacterial regulatory s, tetR family protein [Verrucomicrobiaceae bacterium]|nr:bacterial regulatory s, tetR family protein [Verrucomicrobiaceae bacterium]